MIIYLLPFLITRALGEESSAIASNALSAFSSWNTPKIAFSKTTNSITTEVENTTEDTKTKSETNKNEKQSQNYKFLVEAGNVMD